MLSSKLLGSCTTILLVLSMISFSITHTAFAQNQPTSFNFSGKGVIVESSNFHGTVMWTIIHGNKGTVIIQSPVGRGLAHLSVSQSNACESSASICLFANVTDTKNIQAFKVGDTSRFAINLDNKQEAISILSGFLAGFDVTINLSKVWSK